MSVVHMNCAVAPPPIFGVSGDSRRGCMLAGVRTGDTLHVHEALGV
jgi:hypothetical protein